MTEEILFDVRGDVAYITINRPDRRNAIDVDVVRGLGRAVVKAEEADDVKAVVLTGAGDKAFSAGGDLGGSGDASQVEQHFGRAELGELFSRMRRSSVPIVARLNGHALGGGFGLMLACDLVVAAEEAEIGTPEVNLGLWPFIITAVIQRDIPRKVALEMMLTGARVPASDGARWGFINRVVPRAELDRAVDELVGSVTSKSPLVASLGKRSFYRAEDSTFDESIGYLAGMLTVCLQSEDTIEGVSAFLQKRPPEWKGR